MPPKRHPSPSANSSSPDFADQLAELTTIIKSYAARFDKLEKLLTDTRKENSALRTALTAKENEIRKLQEKLNDQEQYVRGWSIRILNLQIPADEATQPELVMGHVFSRVLEPIFKGALAKKMIPSIPSPHSIIETAHILPAKKDAINPIIVRFYTRNIRNMLFRLKRDFAPRAPAGATAGAGANTRGAQRAEGGRFVYPFFEDLTRVNFDKLRAISNHQDVQSCWSVGGSIRFKLKNSDTVHKVKSVYASVDDIIKG
jgi:hypothetical protein